MLEEEISAMKQELEKYGIQMPAFSKIGGILANEVSRYDGYCLYLEQLMKIPNIIWEVPLLHESEAPLALAVREWWK